MKKLKFLILILVLNLLFSVSSYCETTLPEAMVLTTLAEASLSTFSLLHEKERGALENFGWSAEYSESYWVYRGRGKYNEKDFQVKIVGLLLGKDKQDRMAHFNGLGTLGDEPLEVHGSATWIYDKPKADYLYMDFKQNLKLGKNSIWCWVVGAEILFGGTIGAATAVVGGTIATAGIGLGTGAVVILGAGGFATGSAALISASNGVKSLIESENLPSPPKTPKRPTPPKKGEILIARKGMIYTAVSQSGRIACSDLTGTLILSGVLFKRILAEGKITTINK